MRFSHFTRKTPEYRLSGNKKALNSVSSGLKILVPVAGLEPARIAPPHFECGASANSATPARRSRHADVPRGYAEHIHYSGSRAKSQAPACGARHFAFLKFYMEMD